MVKKDNLSLLTDDSKIETVSRTTKTQNSVGTLMRVQYPINNHSKHYAVNRCNQPHLFKLIQQFYDLSNFECKTKYTINVARSLLQGKPGTGITTIKLINIEYIDFEITNYRVENIKVITPEAIAAADKAAADKAAADAEAKAANVATGPTGKVLVTAAKVATGPTGQVLARVVGEASTNSNSSSR